jgi:hypothetical protein
MSSRVVQVKRVFVRRQTKIGEAVFSVTVRKLMLKAGADGGIGPRDYTELLASRGRVPSTTALARSRQTDRYGWIRYSDPYPRPTIRAVAAAVAIISSYGERTCSSGILAKSSGNPNRT